MAAVFLTTSDYSGLFRDLEACVTVKYVRCGEVQENELVTFQNGVSLLAEGLPSKPMAQYLIVPVMREVHPVCGSFEFNRHKQFVRHSEIPDSVAWQQGLSRSDDMHLVGTFATLHDTPFCREVLRAIYSWLEAECLHVSWDLYVGRGAYERALQGVILSTGGKRSVGCIALDQIAEAAQQKGWTDRPT